MAGSLQVGLEVPAGRIRMVGRNRRVAQPRQSHDRVVDVAERVRLVRLGVQPVDAVPLVAVVALHAGRGRARARCGPAFAAGCCRRRARCAGWRRRRCGRAGRCRRRTAADRPLVLTRARPGRHRHRADGARRRRVRPGRSVAPRPRAGQSAKLRMMRMRVQRGRPTTG